MKIEEIVTDPKIAAAERKIKQLDKQKKQAKIKKKKAELSKLQKNAADNTNSTIQ